MPAAFVLILQQTLLMGGHADRTCLARPVSGPFGTVLAVQSRTLTIYLPALLLYLSSAAAPLGSPRWPHLELVTFAARFSSQPVSWRRRRARGLHRETAVLPSSRPAFRSSSWSDLPGRARQFQPRARREPHLPSDFATYGLIRLNQMGRTFGWGRTGADLWIMTAVYFALALISARLFRWKHE